ncbi:FecR/PupR family sigma factor regulator [Methylomonas sp. HYX-M1]|uniref:FecR/PupR family sigma factor regulator n=1 Tax=Methylomonas sp. HYX-M1 TaxID=3139307 RepID=UPI00345C2DD4
MTAFDQRSFDQAVAWFVALQDERCDAKTRARFERWLASDASHREAYAAAQTCGAIWTT